MSDEMTPDEVLAEAVRLEDQLRAVRAICEGWKDLGKAHPYEHWALSFLAICSFMGVDTPMEDIEALADRAEQSAGGE